MPTYSIRLECYTQQSAVIEIGAADIQLDVQAIAAIERSGPDGLIRVSDEQIAKGRAAGALAWKSGVEETTDRNLEDLTDGLRPGAAALLRESWWRGFMDAVEEDDRLRRQAAFAKKEPR